MVCPASVLSSTLALSLLRHSSTPNQSFVLSPFSLNTALSIVHDGANGGTQKELTNLLLRGCTPDNVTQHYSTLIHSIPSNTSTEVLLQSANRFYVGHSISLNMDYQKHIENKYNVKVKNMYFPATKEAAAEINSFVDDATNGKIKQILTERDLEKASAVLINALYFIGNWEKPFSPSKTKMNKFKGVAGEREMEFMQHSYEYFVINNKNDFGTLLLLPYKNEEYRFLFLMPKETSSLQRMREDLTGEILTDIIKNAHRSESHITVPKFKIESELDGETVLRKMGVTTMFSDRADLSKISDAPLKISKVLHKAVIEVDEKGTEAAAATAIIARRVAARPSPVVLTIDRPFLYGMLRNDDILFLGQLV